VPEVEIFFTTPMGEPGSLAGAGLVLPEQIKIINAPLNREQLQEYPNELDVISNRLILPEGTELAQELSYKVHEGQKRLTGRPFIYHPFEVAYLFHKILGIKDPVEISKLLLHDVVEDTTEGMQILLREFKDRGLDGEVEEGVMCLSKKSDVGPEDYITDYVTPQIFARPMTVVEKSFDNFHNLFVEPFPEEKREKKFFVVRAQATALHGMGMVMRDLPEAFPEEYAEKISKWGGAVVELAGALPEMHENSGRDVEAVDLEENAERFAAVGKSRFALAA